MKKTFYLLAVFTVFLCLVACGSKQTDNVNLEKNNSIKDNVTKEQNMITMEEIGKVEPDNMKNIKVIAGSDKIIDILEKLGYENVVAVPTNLKDKGYVDAVEFGNIEDPDYDLLKELKADIFITDESVEYKKRPNESLSIKILTCSFETEEQTKNSIEYIGKELGLSQKAQEIIDTMVQ